MGDSKKNEIVWEDKPAVVGDITLFPVRMSGYNEWQECKRAILVRQSTLPTKYVFMPYLAALYAVDVDYKTCFTASVLRLLALCTGLPVDKFAVYVSKDDPSKLECIAYNDGVQAFIIDNKNFPRIRQAIADQNGEELPDEGENTELVAAEFDIAAANSSKNIDYNINTLVASVAYQCGIRKREIRDWTIREFVETKNAIDRDKNHLICGIAEKMPMFKWSHGNPCPSWCLDTVKEGSTALESMNTFMSRTGLGTL